MDIGTSFGKHWLDRKEFFSHSGQTLAQLATDKEVKTACEPNGQLYGPAIFRAYYAGLGYGPHYNSIAKRTKAFDYQISCFEHQFSGVHCFQNPDNEGKTVNFSSTTVLEMLPFRNNSTEENSANMCQEGIERVQVDLEPEDLYFFLSENIHEVPPVIGESPELCLPFSLLCRWTTTKFMFGLEEYEEMAWSLA